MEEWIECTLGDILNFRRGHDLPHSEMSGGTIPVAGSNGIIGYHNIASPVSPCITIGRSGNVGTPYMYEKAWAHNTTLYIDDFKGNDPLYIYYLLKTLPLSSFGGGSAVPTLNRNHIHPLIIKHCKNVSKQKEIASILRTFDDKIELNNRINHNLEEQAQSLFDKIISKVTDENVALSTIAEINPTRSLKKNEVARCIDMSYLNTVGSFPSGWEYKTYSGGMKFINGDTLMARITPCLENGKVAYINFLDERETAFGSTEYIVFHAKEGYPNEMFYFLTRNKQFVDYATKNMNGSSGRQRVSGETIGNYIIPKISKDDVWELTTITEATMKQILKNSLESRTLSQMRDTLLPKLMSGELSINEIDC